MLALAALACFAQPYPNRPVRIIVPFAPGGGGDITPRLLGPRMSEMLGQPVVFENRVGAQGTIGLTQVVKSPPDGYTLGVAVTSSVAIFVHLAPVSFDPLKDLTPVGRIAALPHLVVVNASVPVQSVAELVSYVKARPGQVNWASTGQVSLARLSGELFNRAANLNAVHIPYQGGPPAALAIAAGDVAYSVIDPVSVVPHMQSGRVRALAITSLERSPRMPTMPTVAESGYPGFSAVAWVGVFAPAATPPEIVNRLNAAMTYALKDPEVRDRYFKAAADPAPSSPQELGQMLREDWEKWGRLIKEAGIKSE
jgi:tripartite-type tricarboxylate transporter receptor subunit TctC